MHVAIIMDGNGRWATRLGLPRTAGHRAGAGVVRRAIDAAPNLGIGTLTLFAFSADNWRRPEAEVATLMNLFGRYLRGEAGQLAANDVRLSVIGRRDRLPAKLCQDIADAEERTAHGTRLHVRIAVDYSARHAILSAETGPDVDLLIRTGGEQRLSDFMLWEAAYAELWFTPRMWPEFTGDDLAAAVADFHARERRFGGLPGTSAETLHVMQ